MKGDYIMEEIKQALKESVLDILENSDYEVGSEEYSNAMKSVKVLNDAIVNIEQVEQEKGQRTLDICKIVLDALKTVGSIAGSFVLTIIVMKFEEEGILRSKVWAWIPKLWNTKM